MTVEKKIAALIATMTAAELEDFVTRLADMSGDFGASLDCDVLRSTLIEFCQRKIK